MFHCHQSFGDCAVQEYHRYDQRQPLTEIWPFRWAEIFGDLTFESQPWEELATFDCCAYMGDNPGSAPYESVLYRTVRNNLLTTGRVIGRCISEMKMIQYDLDQRRADHDERHGACERVLNEWECNDVSVIATLEWALDAFQIVFAAQKNLYEKNKLFFEAMKRKEPAIEYQSLMVRELPAVDRDVKGEARDPRSDEDDYFDYDGEYEIKIELEIDEYDEFLDSLP